MSFNIFNSKTRKRVILEEGEAPPSKANKEAEALIKSLTTKQLTTKVTLKEQLNVKQDFQTGEEHNTLLSQSNAGFKSLSEFQSVIHDSAERSRLKNILCDEDISLYYELKSCQDINEILKNHSNVDSKVLNERIKYIKDAVEARSNVDSETNQLVASNIRHPKEGILDLYNEFSDNIHLFSNQNTSKIQKKARNLANRINSLEDNLISEPKNKLNICKQISKKSLWDIKETPQIKNHNYKQKVADKDKIYTCPKQNFYTIRNGEIVKLNSESSQPQDTQQGIRKLSLDAIKGLPKFVDYTPGEPSDVLFIKKLPKSIIREKFLNVLQSFLVNKEFTLKLMTGKMKGQAFIKFKNTEDAKSTLSSINGILIQDKPMIVQFGKKKVVAPQLNVIK